MERLVTVQFHKSLWCPDSMLALGAAVGTAAVPCPRGPQARPGDPRATTVHVPQLSAPEEPWPLAWDPSTLQPLLGARVGRAVGWSPSASVASSLQPPKDDAAIVGAVRLFSVLIAALTMDLAGRKVLLFISGEHRPAPPSAVGRAPAEQWALWLGALGWGCGAVMPALGACPPPGAQHRAWHTPAAPGKAAGRTVWPQLMHRWAELAAPQAASGHGYGGLDENWPVQGAGR